ncbi:MAG: response regulator [Heyndrickxia sp.]
MKAILIDDEKLALDYLEHQLLKAADVQIVGKYTNPLIGKERVLKEEVDIVFLDIQLPEVNGIELAEQILLHNPKANIVFITAYDRYAIEAFELNALDYILKPVSPERLVKTIQRIQKRGEEGKTVSIPTARKIHIKQFKQVLIETEGSHYTPLRWRTAKAQELFHYLLHHNGQLIRKSALIELLWPEYEPNRAYAQLYTAIYHIRKTLDFLDTHFQISNVMDGYILTMEDVQLDVEEWENYMLLENPVDEKTIEQYEKLMLLYTDDYLSEYDYWWAESKRQRLRDLWLRKNLQIAEWYYSSNQIENAIEKYHEICRRHPVTEEAHYALMQIYASEQNNLLVHQQYDLLTKVLMEEFNEHPSSYITEWYQNWNEISKE